MSYTSNLGLRIWSSSENPSFQEWRAELNSTDSNSALNKIDQFAENVAESLKVVEEAVEKNKDNIESISVDVEALKTDLVKATVDEAIAGVRDDRYMTPYLVSEFLKQNGNTGGLESVALKRVIESVYTDTENQKEIEIPFSDFKEGSHHLEVRVGGVPFFHERYTIQNNKVVLNDTEVGLAKDKRVDFVILYLEQTKDGITTTSLEVEELKQENQYLGQMITEMELALIETQIQVAGQL